MDTLTRLAEILGLDVRTSTQIEVPNVDRVDMAALFKYLDLKIIVEIGVERAQFTEVLCQQNPQAHVYGVDCWKVYRQYRDHVNQSRLDGFFLEATERVKPYRCSLIRKFSADAARDFEDESIDAIYLDGNHSYPHVVADLHVWERKVRPQGIISGHDWRKLPLPNMMHVPQAVGGWCEAFEIQPLIIFGRSEKRDGERRDEARSWLFVKPEPKARAGRIRQ